MKTVLLVLLLSAVGEDVGVLQKVYVQGSSINLRKEPGKDAEVLVKAPIGTECAVTCTAAAEWMKVRCGDYEGYAAASLVGSEKPSVETLKAEAKNPMLTPEHREESALRAALLAPDDVELPKLLGESFFERNFQLTAAYKAKAQSGKPLRTFTTACGFYKPLKCLTGAVRGGLQDVKVRVETKKDLFVAAIEDDANVTIYRGRYVIEPTTAQINGELFEKAQFETTPLMDKALFAGIEKEKGSNTALPFGQFSLDETAQSVLSQLPSAWALLKPDDQGLIWMHVNDCSKDPYGLRFKSDIHGRWIAVFDKISIPAYSDYYWISAVSKRDNTLELAFVDMYGSRTSRETFKLPEGKKDIAYMGETAYTFKLHRYPGEHHPCREGGQ
jgi:uncharacterized protein YgiM (DUF1202 family)